MAYTIREMARRLGIASPALRCCGKEGLLPFAERSSGGVRLFREKDVKCLQAIGCMKAAGMSIRERLELTPAGGTLAAGGGAELQMLVL